MEIYNVVGAAGFLMSTIVLIMLALLFIQYEFYLQIPPIFVLIVPFFVAGIIMRGIAWMELGKRAADLKFFATGALVILLGAGMLYAFSGLLQYGVNLPMLSNLAQMTDVSAIIILWAVYSVMEFMSLKRTFKTGLLRLSTFTLLGVVLVIISLFYLDNYTVYILSASFCISAIGTFFAAIGFLGVYADAKSGALSRLTRM